MFHHVISTELFRGSCFGRQRHVPAHVISGSSSGAGSGAGAGTRMGSTLTEDACADVCTVCVHIFYFCVGQYVCPTVDLSPPS